MPTTMNMKRTLATLAAGLLACHSALALEITDVRASSRAITPGEESVAITYRIDQPASISLHFYDGRDRNVRTLTDKLQPGEHTLTWDGRDERGNPVPAEAYHYAIEGVSQTGETQIYDLSDLTGGEQLSANEVHWDPATGTIDYRLAEMARVNIRIGLANAGPLLKTLVDWVPRAGGLHQERWDGFDESQVLDLSQHPKLRIFVDAYSLSDNTIMVGSAPDESSFIAYAGEKRAAAERSTRRKRMHHHADQPLETRGDIPLNFSIAADYPKSDGFPLVKGQVPIRLEVDEPHRKRVLERRFEPVFFIDGTFAFENEVGYLPFTWLWDSTTTPPGEHYISVNLRGYEGNFGVATMKVIVDEQPTQKSAPADEVRPGSISGETKPTRGDEE